MSETLSNNYLISQFISSAELYRSQYLSLLEKLVSSLVTEEDKIAILTELGSVEISSNNFLNKKILNLENLFTSILNGQSVIGPDGIGRRFESIDNLTSTISIDNQILYSASRKFLDLFVTLKLPINIGKSENANIRLYKFDTVNSIINLVPEFIDEFYSVTESEFLRDCSINNVNVSLFDFNENGMSKKSKISGDFDIFRVTYNNLNNIKIELNSLYCNEPSRNLLNSRILKKDDLLITKNASSAFKIKEVLTVDNSIIVELIFGNGKISQLDKLYVKVETDNEIQISVLPNEKLVLFIRTDGSVEEPKSKFVNVSNSVIYDSVGNIVNPNSLNDLERVFNYFKGLFLERRISLFSGVVPNVAILQSRNFRIVRLNPHRTNPTWRISGFWEIPASIQNQSVVAFKVQYRYLSLNEEFPVESNSQEILLNGVSTVGSTSNWNEIQTTTRRKVLVNGIWVWEPGNESNSNIRSFNSIELPIENREKIQIRVKSLSEVGFDTNNPFESEWSNIVELKLNENILLTSEEVLTRISAIENEITNNESLEISINSSSINQQLNWNEENVIELENYSTFINNTNLRNGDFNISNFQLKIKNTSLNPIVLRSRDFSFVGNVKSSNSVDLTFDSFDREYNEFLKYDLFSFDNLIQRKSQILRLRGSSLLGDNLNINLNSGSNILKTCDYALLDSLIRNNNGNVYTPTGNVYLNDILSLNLSNWFYISKDSINHNISQNLSFSQNKLISVSNLSLKNEFDENIDKYLIGPLSNGISVKLSTDLSKISTDLYGNFKLESNQEIIVDIKIKSRFLDYLGNSYKEEYVKTIGLDIYLKDLTRKSIDLKFKQK